MPVVRKNLLLQARSLVCLVTLFQAGLAFGSIVPLPKGPDFRPAPQIAEPVHAPEVSAPYVLFAPPEVMNAAVPAVDLSQASIQASAPAPVPLPPALETGLSGGAAIMLAAGLRKLRRIVRRGF